MGTREGPRHTSPCYFPEILCVSPSPKCHSVPSACVSLAVFSHTPFLWPRLCPPSVRWAWGRRLCPPLPALTISSPAAEGGAEALGGRGAATGAGGGCGGPGGRRGREGGPAGGGAAGLVPLPVPSPQELSKRQVVAVGHLEVPVELAGLLRAVAGTSAPGGVVGAGARGDQAPHGLLCPQASGRARCPGWPPCGLPGFRLSPGSRCPWISTTTPWPSLSGATSR